MLPKRTLTQSGAKRRERLLVVLPELLQSLERKHQDQDLCGKAIKEIDLAFQGVSRFVATLRVHETAHDICLGKVVGSDEIGRMYYGLTGGRDLSHFLENDYGRVEELFAQKATEVPFVMRELHRLYWGMVR